jgi:hypothetical protein
MRRSRNLIKQVENVGVNGCPTTACTRLPFARYIKGQASASLRLIGDSLAGPAAGEAEALARNPCAEQN